MFCKKCGKKISEDSLFCKKCGNKINDILEIEENTEPSEGEIVETPQVSSKDTYPKKHGISTGLGASFVFLAYILGIFIYGATIFFAYVVYGFVGLIAFFFPFVATVFMFFIALANGIMWFVYTCIAVVIFFVLGVFFIGYSQG